MFRNVLIALIGLFALLLLIDHARRGQARAFAPPPAPSGAVAAVGAHSEAIGAQARPATVDPGPALVPPTGTPAFDLVARLATRRRIAREGDRIYLDSAFSHTDSVVARWSDRTSLIVALVADTSLAGWSPALLDEARLAMRAWDGAGSGITLREAGATDSADITVHWADVLPDSGQVGTTTLHWTPDGVAHSATIALALRRNTDSAVVPAAARERVAVHEFGHALGLPHSNSPDDVMFRTSPVSAPSGRDQATLRLLYVLLPGSIRVQP